jgi:hypothetical protein
MALIGFSQFAGMTYDVATAGRLFSDGSLRFYEFSPTCYLAYIRGIVRLSRLCHHQEAILISLWLSLPKNR